MGLNCYLFCDLKNAIAVFIGMSRPYPAAIASNNKPLTEPNFWRNFWVCHGITSKTERQIMQLGHFPRARRP
jgi:hypothetical protein